MHKLQPSPVAGEYRTQSELVGTARLPSQPERRKEDTRRPPQEKQCFSVAERWGDQDRGAVLAERAVKQGAAAAGMSPAGGQDPELTFGSSHSLFLTGWSRGRTADVGERGHGELCNFWGHGNTHNASPVPCPAHSP